MVFALEYAVRRIALPALLYRQRRCGSLVRLPGVILAIVVFGYYGAVYNASSFAYFKF